MNLIWVAANLRHSKANSHRPAKVVAGQVKSSRGSPRARSYNRGTNSVTLADKPSKVRVFASSSCFIIRNILDRACWVRRWSGGVVVE